ncbi:MAG TPA: carboxypeptidase regulatory-like domain-containing protein, partial [Candidatus Acidoferrales bacterium]|nr:carboxypeptidase regulatory-like domain-containing protein [Candidatus Acidoferrales bacterium]
MKNFRKLSLVGVLAALFCAAAFGQGGATGAISGSVQDASGAAIAGARVIITSEATGQIVRELISDSSGLFSANLLPAGMYSIEASATGFSPTKFSGIEVRVTETARMAAVLKVTSVKEEITVTAEVAAVNTTAPTTGESLGTTEVTDLPMATRNFQTLLTLSAGASSDLNSATQLGRGQVYMHVNGGREDNNNYLIEGISASDPTLGELTNTPLPSPDAIQEFKVSTSLYDATQGRNGGGNIDAVLKTGTSHYHFDAWEYFRNTVLDANDFFINAAGEQRPAIKQNIFGGDIGGPVDPGAKLGFFYVNYQGTRQRSGDSPGTFINTEIPVLPATGRSAASLTSLFFPDIAGCPGTFLPPGVTSLDPVAVNILTAANVGNQFGPGSYLFPSVAGTPGINPATCSYNTGPLVLNSTGKFTDDQFTTNWDREFGSKDHLSFRFFWSDSDIYQPFGADNLQIQTGGVALTTDLNFPLDTPLHGRFGSITETHIIDNGLVNEFRFGVNIIGTVFNQSPILSPSDVGINRPTDTGDIYRLQFVNFQFGSYPTQPQTDLSDSFAFIDTLSWTKGKHAFRFGAEADRITLRRELPVLDNGLLYFVPGTYNTTDFQNFLLGAPLVSEAGGGVANHDYRIPAYSLFLQDDYRVTNSLTLNLGFREDFNGAPFDTLCHIGNTDPALAGATGVGFIYPNCVNNYSLPGLSGHLQETGLNNNFASVWEPRIGFAYDLLGHHTTSIRGGYGIYSVREDLGAVDNLSFSIPFYPVAVGFAVPAGSLANLFTGSVPGVAAIPPLGTLSPSFVPTPSILQGFVNNVSGAPTTDTTQTPVFSGNAIDYIGLEVPLHWISPTTQQWNLTVQRELGANWFLEAGYVGTKGTHLRVTYDPEQGQLLGQPGFPSSLTVTAQNGTQYTITQNTASNVNARAQYLGIAPDAFEAFSPISDSHFNALQLTVAHHFSRGLYFQSAYTYADSIDDVSTSSVAFLTRVNNQVDARDSRGLSDFDRRHRWVDSFVYQLPFFKHAHGFEGAALGGWEASGVFTLQSGAPFTVYDGDGGTAASLASTPSTTANFAPGFSCANAATPGSTIQRLGAWLNPAAFEPAPIVGPDGSTGYGNTPRNCFIGPYQANFDFTV